MPKPFIAQLLPAKIFSDNETTKVAAPNTGKRQTTTLMNLTENNDSENHTSASAVIDAAENQTASLIQTTLTQTLPDALHKSKNNMTVSKSRRPVFGESTQITVNKMKSKPTRITQLTKRFYGRFFLRLEPIVVFRVPLQVRRRVRSFRVFQIQR